MTRIISRRIGLADPACHELHVQAAGRGGPLDCCLIPLAYYTSYRLRFEGDLLGLNYRYFIQSMPIVLAAQLIALFIVGGYRGAWRHFGMMDAVVFAKGVMLGTAAAGSPFCTSTVSSTTRGPCSSFTPRCCFCCCRAHVRRFVSFGEFVERRREVGHRCVIYGTSGAALSHDSRCLRRLAGPQDPWLRRRRSSSAQHASSGISGGR